MRTANAWQDLLQLEPEFLELEKAVREGALADYRAIPPEAFAWHAWDLLPQERLFALIWPFILQQLERASRCMPRIYGVQLGEVAPQALRPQDWHSLPLLFKDDHAPSGSPGFRAAAAADPRALLPADAVQGQAAFVSGGSLGRATPTFVSLADRQREVSAWRRGHDYHGLQAGDTALYTYNTTHKGGQWMQESLLAHGVNTLLRRPEENAAQVLENIRRYRVNALFTVQQPYEIMQSQSKAAGLNLHSLIAASLENPQFEGLLLPDNDGRRQIEFLFLGGFPIVPYARELLEEYLPGLPAATLLGSSEAIPQACSTNPALTGEGRCHLNNLHLLQGPHWIEILKQDGQHWAPVAKGERGLLVYTSWARDGTIWIRYAPGDAATLLLGEGECPCGLHSPVISDVARLNPDDIEELLQYGCAAG